LNPSDAKILFNTAMLDWTMQLYCDYTSKLGDFILNSIRLKFEIKEDISKIS
jgi:hypothetical protein